MVERRTGWWWQRKPSTSFSSEPFQKAARIGRTGFPLNSKQFQTELKISQSIHQIKQTFYKDAALLEALKNLDLKRNFLDEPTLFSMDRSEVELQNADHVKRIFSKFFGSRDCSPLSVRLPATRLPLTRRIWCAHPANHQVTWPTTSRTRRTFSKSSRAASFIRAKT